MIILLPYLSLAVMVNPERTIKKSEIKNSDKIVVINVLIKKITKNKIYSQNGKVYVLKRNTKIIKNFKKKPIVAELHFKNKKLIEVILK